MPASPELTPARASGLDPRTKLALAAIVSVVVMVPDGLRFVAPALLLGVALAASVRAWKRALGLLAVAALCWLLGWLVPVWWPNRFTEIISAIAGYSIRFVAIAGVGIHLVTTTSATRLNAGLRAARFPRAICVPLAVMLRFFPVVAAEATAVMDAMRLRGLTGAGGLVRHPVLAAERFTVPMIAASLRAGDDLSASAILRGLGSGHRPTAMVPPRFGVADLVLGLSVIALAVAAIALPSPLDWRP